MSSPTHVRGVPITEYMREWRRRRRLARGLPADGAAAFAEANRRKARRYFLAHGKCPRCGLAGWATECPYCMAEMAKEEVAA